MNREEDPNPLAAQDADEDDAEMVELDLDAVQAAIDAFADSGLDFGEGSMLADHLSGLTASLLRKLALERGLEEEQVAEAAAEIAAFAVDIALSEEELPEFRPESSGMAN